MKFCALFSLLTVYFAAIGEAQLFSDLQRQIDGTINNLPPPFQQAARGPSNNLFGFINRIPALRSQEEQLPQIDEPVAATRKHHLKHHFNPMDLVASIIPGFGGPAGRDFPPSPPHSPHGLKKLEQMMTQVLDRLQRLTDLLNRQNGQSNIERYPYNPSTSTERPHYYPDQSYGQNDYGQNDSQQDYDEDTEEFNRPDATTEGNFRPEFNFTRPQFNFSRPEFDNSQPNFNFSQPQFNFSQPQSNFSQPQFNFSQPQFNFSLPQVNFSRPIFDASESAEFNTDSSSEEATINLRPAFSLVTEGPSDESAFDEDQWQQEQLA